MCDNIELITKNRIDIVAKVGKFKEEINEYNKNISG